MPRPEVAHTIEFSRIEALPRRVLDPIDASHWAEVFTEQLRAPGSTAELRRWQGQCFAEAVENRGGFYVLPVGLGKAQPNTEPVLTPEGWRPIGSLRVGDSVIGSSGAPTPVVGVFPQGVRKIMRLRFSDGTDALCDEEHLWTLEAGDRNSSTRTAKEWAAMRLSRPCGAHTARIWWLPRHPTVQRPEAELPLDPYTLGALLGDGCMRRRAVSFTSMDQDIVDALRLPPGLRLIDTHSKTTGKAKQYRITRGNNVGSWTVKNPLVEILVKLGLQGHDSFGKFVPRVYLDASPTQRLALLQGLFDTDGHSMASGAVEFCTTSTALCDDVIEIVQSLGGVASIVNNSTLCWRLNVRLPKEHDAFRCARKAKHHAAGKLNRQREPRRALLSVEPAGEAECTCIAIDTHDHLYLTRNCILTHNTVLSYLLGHALGGKRVLLILPANLIKSGKTAADFRSYIGQWVTPNPPPWCVSREWLALDANANYLEQFQPDVIVIDESDELANFDSATAQRLDRYIMARTREQCAVFCMSGTPSRNSIMAYWHLLRWCLRGNAPVPRTRGEASKWAQAVDQIKTADDMTRMGPGPLGFNRASAVRWFRERLQQTPGVVIIDGDSAGDIPLTIRQRTANECPKLDAAFADFMVKQEDPDGMTCADPLGRWRLDGFLGCGLFPRYRLPGPPPEWLARRRERGRAFAALCRTVIQSTRSHRDPADTERQVRKRYPGHPVIAAWDEIKDDPYPKEVVWLSSATLDTAAAWLAEADTPGIIWCGSVEFARELARRMRLPYYGREGRDQNGNGLHAAPPGKSFIASWNANKKGFNLQPWRRHAVFVPPSSAKWLEQLFGRAHRAGQSEPVTFDLFMTSGGRFDAFESSIEEARFARDSVGPRQKILRAKIVRVRALTTGRSKYRWARAER